MTEPVAFPLPEIEAAAEFVHAVMAPTPTLHWPLLSQRVGAEVWVKHENHTAKASPSPPAEPACAP